MNVPAKALDIIRILRKNGYTAYFCGGCVRDFLLHRTPKDFDIVTNATCDQIKKIFKRTILVGAKFGVIKVMMDQEIFEVATFRQDGEYRDGRHPEFVTLGDEKQDAYRRDFTINGMFYDPISHQIIDHVQGQNDLQLRIIRTIGVPQERFAEDYLRLMRAIRFACQLDFVIEENTWQSVLKMAHLITKVSGERIRDELVRMMLSPHPSRAWSLLYQAKMLSLMFPELYDLPISSQIWADCVSAIFNIAAPVTHFDFAVVLMLHPLSKYATIHHKSLEKVIGRLYLPKKNSDWIICLLEHYNQFAQVMSMSKASLKKFLRIPGFEYLLQLHHYECIIEDKSQIIYDYCLEKLQQWGPEQLHPIPLINGQDLIQLGFSPGPLFQTILLAIEEQQLEGNISHRLQAIDWIQQQFVEEAHRGQH